MNLKPEELELILKALYRLLYPDSGTKTAYPPTEEQLKALIGKLEIEYQNS